MTLELSAEDHEMLILVLGIALGTTHGNRSLFLEIIRLANRINKDNPNWRPYEVPEK